MILTAVDISKSALQRKTVTRASEVASAGDKSSRDGAQDLRRMVQGTRGGRGGR